MIRQLIGCLSFAAVVTVVACSSDEADKYPSSDSFCAAVADQECQGVASVCGASLDACKQKRLPVCTQAASDAVAQGRKYAASLAENCINKTRDLYQAKTIAPEKETEQQEACARVFEGQKDKSQNCTTNYDCKGSMVCDKKVCADKVVKNEKDPCNNPGEVCSTGSYCGAQGDLKFCLSKKGLADICNADVPCKETYRCYGTCMEKYKAGEVCASSDECVTEAPYCDPTQKRCIAKSFAAGSPACKDFGGF